MRASVSFTANTLVVLRESLEALLIIGVLTGIVTRLQRPEMRRTVYWGAGAGLALSIVFGVAVIASAQGLSHTAEEAFEGLASLFAVAVLTYMVVWMYGHTRHLLGVMKEKAQTAVETGKGSALWTLAFIAVAREGFETVVFVGASATEGAFSIVAATLLGIGISLAVAALLFSGVVRLDLKGFFGVTGALLVLFAGGLLMTGLHELMEIGWIPSTPTAWDLGWLLHDEGTFGSLLHAVFGYRHDPRVLEIGAWLLYVGGLGAWYLRRVFASPAPQAAADEA